MYTFENIYGNEKIIANLQNSISKSRASHAYIFLGQAGLGKKLLANSFAKTLQCRKHGTLPCNECVSCVTFESGNHPDVFYVHPEKTKSLGVDDIRRQVTKPMETRPYSSPYKIFIIEQADLMTPAAANALLKTIEEPSGFGIFLLLGESNNFLPTVISRCIVLRLKPLTNALVKKYLVNKGLTDSEGETLSIYAQGNIGRALALSTDEEFTEMRNQVIDILMLLEDCHGLDAMLTAKRLEPFKSRIQEALDIAYLWYHDIIMATELGDSAENYFSQRDKMDIIITKSRTSSLRALFVKAAAVWDAKMRLRHNANFQLTVEVLMIKINGA